jgi:hypothetical protein
MQPRRWKMNYLSQAMRDNTTSDELRSEYRRNDFGVMVRGKYAARLKESSSILALSFLI